MHAQFKIQHQIPLPRNSSYVGMDRLGSHDVWRFGLAVRRQAGQQTDLTMCGGPAVRRQTGQQTDVSSIPLRLSFLFKSCGLRTLSTIIVTFPATMNEISKWLTPPSSFIVKCFGSEFPYPPHPQRPPTTHPPPPLRISVHTNSSAEATRH